MKILHSIIIAAAVLLTATPVPAAMQNGGKAPVNDVWKPASTPKGGTSWAVLQATKEKTRKGKDGYIYSKPLFTPAVKSLAGKRIKVAGWMMPLDKGAKQKNFVLLAYPPGCPFHFHAMPNQFIEVLADIPFTTDERNVHVVSGILELTGQDESGIFYRLKAASPS
tara:strand:+ start:610 stop:1107 length:498 start_codon:yes stop_codon:yes gene_type:complete